MATKNRATMRVQRFLKHKSKEIKMIDSNNIISVMQKYMDEGRGSTLEQLILNAAIVKIRTLEQQLAEKSDADQMNDSFRQGNLK